MGALKLCTYKKAEYPLYLEMLSLHVYTMEELCYAMESSLFLLDESWMGTEFFQWIAEGVGNAELAGQLRRLYQRHRDVYECAAFLFSASGFYSRQEQKELERIIEKMKGKNSMERRKMKADYYLAKKRYRYAACGYLELLQPEKNCRGILCIISVWFMPDCFCSRRPPGCFRWHIRNRTRNLHDCVICMP